MVGGLACEWVPKDGSAVDRLAVAVGGCVGCGGWQRLCFDFGGFILFIYKVVLVDVGLCRWWLLVLLQLRWLCHC